MTQDHPFLAALDEEQLDLIHVIGRPWVVNDLADARGWPTWDFVRRHFEKNTPTTSSAAEVLASLPAIGSPAFSNGSYGLWWRTEPRAGEMRPDERVGLTIAGVSHLDRKKGDDAGRVDLVTVCLDIVGTAADREAELAEDLDWSKVATGQFDLRTERFRQDSQPPVEIIGQVLSHEFVPQLAIGTTNFNYEVQYGNSKFRPFKDARTVEQYLAVADALMTFEAASDLSPSPLALPAALDYLGLALHVHPEWDVKTAFVDLPGFEAAGSICQLPGSRVEFDQRCSDLWTIIGRLRVPEASDSDHQSRGWDPAHKGSLNNLDIWLRGQLGAEEYGITCAPAMTALRALGRVRQGSQHTSQETRVKRDQALSQFGLPSVITDWPSAWRAILQRYADAAHAIANAVRRTEVS